MKHILVIAPASLPVSSAEGIVNTKLLKALSQSGEFVIDLVSKKLKSGPYPSIETPDAKGIQLRTFVPIEVPNNLNIKSIWQHIKCLLKFGSVAKGSHWAVEALPIVTDLVKNNHYDYILTKNFPSSLIGAYIKRHFNIKWIATWNDPFPDNSYPPPYGSGTNAKRNIFERKMLAEFERYADYNIFPTERIKNYTLEYVALDRNKSIVLPHVAFPKSVDHSLASNDTLKLLHSGNLGYPRDAHSFLKGLRLFLNKKPDINIEFSILGRINDGTQAQIKEQQLENIVKILPPVNYDESISMLKRFHIAIIIEADCKNGIFLPTKVADYMENDMPIFTISPNTGTLNDLYKAKNIPYFADVTDPESIASELEQVYNDFIHHNLQKSICPDNYTASYIVNEYMKF